MIFFKNFIAALATLNFTEVKYLDSQKYYAELLVKQNNLQVY